VALVRGLLRAVLVTVLVTMATGALVDLLPGDPAVAILGPAGTANARAQITEELRLDEPVPVRWAHWVGAAATGDLGLSYPSRIPVADRLGPAIPLTLELLAYSQLLALAIAVPLALEAAARPRGLLDRLSGLLMGGLLATPSFVVGLLLVFLVAERTAAFPVVHPGGAAPLENVRLLFLPACTLACATLPVYQRILRSAAEEVLAQPYIDAAQSRGLPRRHVLYRHVLRPSSGGLVAMAGIATGALVAGTVVVEALFSVPGVAGTLVTAVSNRDIDLVQGCVLLIALVYVATMLAVDLLTPCLDPRTRRAR
jgi:peptide/nickel transport system permease protein